MVEEVRAKLGAPQYVLDREEGGHTLVYIERKHRVVKCAYMGGMMGATYSMVLALASAPFTFGAGFLAVPLCAVLGTVGGAVVGLFLKMDGARMHVDVGENGKVIKTWVD